jgi:hypothetical protein
VTPPDAEFLVQLGGMSLVTAHTIKRSSFRSPTITRNGTQSYKNRKEDLLLLLPETRDRITILIALFPIILFALTIFPFPFTDSSSFIYWNNQENYVDTYQME